MATAEQMVLPTGREVSASAYHEQRRTGATLTRRMQVLTELCVAGHAMTRQEIGEQSGMAINAVCGRVNELLGLGYVEVCGIQHRADGPSRQMLAPTAAGWAVFESAAAHEDAGGKA